MGTWSSNQSRYKFLFEATGDATRKSLVFAVVVNGWRCTLCNRCQYSFGTLPGSACRKTRAGGGTALRMSIRRLILALAAALAFASHAAAQSRAECGSMPSRILKHPVAYCALLPPSFDRSAPKPGQEAKGGRVPILYY